MQSIDQIKNGNVNGQILLQLITQIPSSKFTTKNLIDEPAQKCCVLGHINRLSTEDKQYDMFDCVFPNVADIVRQWSIDTITKNRHKFNFEILDPREPASIAEVNNGTCGFSNLGSTPKERLINFCLEVL